MCDWNEIDGIITDCNISNDIYETFSKRTNIIFVMTETSHLFLCLNKHQQIASGRI